MVFSKGGNMVFKEGTWSLVQAPSHHSKLELAKHSTLHGNGEPIISIFFILVLPHSISILEW